MFDKILIANRGEIACRIIRTARRLGVATVAVYSDADATAQHVALADQAVRIGPAPVAQSYLRGEAIIAAAKETGAQAIHPGYGFLSENPEFVDAVEAAGLTFIGPSGTAIRAMGLKDAAKALMAEAGVPVVPGYHEADQSDEVLAAAAEEVGYPVLIKAVAGGGGKGMRRVDTPDGFAAALASARGEARTAFGNDAVLIEKFIQSPRHIEIQVFGDRHGNVVHLFERDCTLQRRHQKVIEEAPAPGMTPQVRAAMGAAAVAAAEAIDYHGAGTVEFIVDGSDGLRADRFWFMEMNTRLQVEHPVTEAITGVDLVEWQLRVASGEPLPARQSDLSISGHAMEARLYAEDPSRGFLPAIGTLTHLEFPAAARADSGVVAGDAISPHYDPMIAKLIVHGPTRDTALTQMHRALSDTAIAGTVTNLPFLATLVRHPGFRAAEMDTGLIDRDLEDLTDSPPCSDAVIGLAAIVAQGGTDDPLAGFHLWKPLVQEVALVHDDEEITVQIERLGADRYRVTLEEDRFRLSIRQEGNRYRLETNTGVTAAVTCLRSDTMVTVLAGAQPFRFERRDPLQGRGDEGDHAGGDIRAPMPGLVKAVLTEEGAEVEKGAPLLILEAMKMEHTLTAPRAGRIASLPAAEGATVTDGTLLARLEDADG
ncbi:acetyl-CoA carboxylase biotin carboxylase subunit [Oceanomicrobium pacificus]|uniref:Acetyl-CoA carboxylase biotin carboxylase subunit n=1 Tax=Oceanomicrobium pacificus TaxID=2692916 RepID=A0A6B0TQ24_9RHOB|nr:acetyl/propionyl/methylcrotonyl-CoA carboxylase subunit alpha [Oceanomicrobium pacificus]MXU63895.1 acetyl-CoA carboxylase biotin carboxylase subunit [Oceanomicrobium pacificus]